MVLLELALKELLGTIELESIKVDCIIENGNLIESKPYYMAHSNIDPLALLDKRPIVRIVKKNGRDGIRTANPEHLLKSK